jgi:hypothetical protein
MGYQPQMVAHPLQQPHPTAQQQGNVFQNIEWASRIADMMKSQFSLKPKEPTYMYRRPYPEAYNQVAMPHRYRLSYFTKFSGHDNITTIEHISLFLVQCREASGSDALKIRLFPLSLSRSAFA